MMMRQTRMAVFGAVLVAGMVGCDQVPEKMRELMSSNEKVKTYQSFSEINATKPLAAHFDLSVTAIVRMAFIDQALKYEIAAPDRYNPTEQAVMKFFQHPGLEKSLRLVNYARQLKADHPYRVNPFVPFFTLARENRFIADTKPGPAALISSILQPKGSFQGRLDWKDYQGNSYQFDVKMSPETMPRTGGLLLFDHDLFDITGIITNPESNVLQDVIVHEFTHIWDHELVSDQAKGESNVESNKTVVGHDTMIVSNPALAFSEGLAESFEALYGTTASQLMSMSKEERAKFFGKFHGSFEEKLDFLVNRQIYIRRNSYLYNLYDFKDCTLRIVQADDAAKEGPSAKELIDKIMRGESVDLDLAMKKFDFKNFHDRFYGGSGRVSTKFLKDNCRPDSPGRLEAKEGFVASLLYSLISSGALVSDEELQAPAEVAKAKLPVDQKKLRLERFVAFAKNDLREPADWKTPYLPSAVGGRALADNSERLKILEKNFLLGFRQIVLGILKGDAITLKGLMEQYFGSDSVLPRDTQVKLAFQVLKVSAGAFFKAETADERKLKELFLNSDAVRENLPLILEQLDRMYAARELGKVAARLGEVPAIYVQFDGKLGKGMRFNVNLAHHVNLIDMFGENSRALTELAKRLDRGEYFRNEAEFLDFADTIGKKDKAQLMLDTAQAGLKDIEKLRKSIRSTSLRASTLN
ncbi:MAG: hypothetical protein NDJ90_04420 [Oligoflexia bacterium]|nr:hypothetical protein [Oligoflexia bacterium]